MATRSYPLLNGVAPSWADLSVTIQLYSGPSIKTADIAGLSWSDSVEVGTQRGTSGGRKLKRTTGQYDCEGSITFYNGEGYEAFETALAAKDKRISLVVFDVMVQHTPPNSTQIYTVKLVGCRMLGRGSDPAEGSDPDQIEVPLSVMLVERNGRTLL